MRGVALSPDGKTLASCSGDYNNHDVPAEVKLWDLTTGKENAALDGPRATASSRWPSRRTARRWPAPAGTRRPALWDVATGKERAKLTGHTNAVRNLAFSPDGKTLATASWDRTVKLWDVETGKEQATLSTGLRHGCQAVRLLAGRQDPGGGRQAGRRGRAGGAVELWDVATRDRKTVLKGGIKGGISCLAFAPDGKTLVSGGGEWAKFGEIGAVGRDRRTAAGRLHARPRRGRMRRLQSRRQAPGRLRRSAQRAGTAGHLRRDRQPVPGHAEGPHELRQLRRLLAGRQDAGDAAAGTTWSCSGTPPPAASRRRSRATRRASARSASRRTAPRWPAAARTRRSSSGTWPAARRRRRWQGTR